MFKAHSHLHLALKLNRKMTNECTILIVFRMYHCFYC